MEQRELFWNVKEVGFVTYLIMGLAVLIFAYLFYERVKMWKRGRAEKRCESPFMRFLGVVTNILGQMKVLRETYPGVMHVFIFWGFMILLAGTAIEAFDHYAKTHLLKGKVYLAFAFIMDLGGAMALLGTIMAATRRYIWRPRALDNRKEDAFVLVMLAIVLLTGFLVEGARLAAQAASAPWEKWSFVGWNVFKNFFNHSNALLWHKLFWWIHLLSSFIFVVVLVHTKLLHLLTSILSTFFRNLSPQALKLIENIEEAESFGVNKIEEFTWVDLMQLDACVRCGRCQESCPAFLTNKPLNPKDVIQNLKSHFLETSRPFISRLRIWGVEEDNYGDVNEKTIIGTVIEEDAIWACTTCASCIVQCPMYIEQFPKLIEMRRYLVLMESRFPQELQTAFRNLENNSNPWGIGMHTRGDWAKEEGVKTLSEDPEVEYLFFVGCAGSFDERNKKVAISISKILQAAGIKFGILGSEENCCGDSARRLGNEYLYQILAKQNIETIKNYGVKKILTMCPHCYNTLRNEYPQLGGVFEVYHYVELFSKLIETKKLRLINNIPLHVTYHDSCYLGRYNSIYKEPRFIINSIPSIKLFEMKRSKDKSLCCGAGGGRFWMEEHLGMRINHSRIEDVKNTRAQLVVSSCPFCLTMLSDAIKEKELEDQLQAKDLSEILREAIGV